MSHPSPSSFNPRFESLLLSGTTSTIRPLGIQQNILVSDVGLRQEERETARNSGNESTSPIKDKEPPLELRQAATTWVHLHAEGAREQRIARDNQPSTTRDGAGCGVETHATRKADTGAPKRPRYVLTQIILPMDHPSTSSRSATISGAYQANEDYISVSEALRLVPPFKGN